MPNDSPRPFVGWREQLAKRSTKCAERLEWLKRHDAGASEFARESFELADMIERLTGLVDAGYVRLETALALMDRILSLQENIIAERTEQIRRKWF